MLCCEYLYLDHLQKQSAVIMKSYMSDISKQTAFYVFSVGVQVVSYTYPQPFSSLYVYYFGSTRTIQYDAVYVLLRPIAAVCIRWMKYDVSHNIDR